MTRGRSKRVTTRMLQSRSVEMMIFIEFERLKRSDELT